MSTERRESMSLAHARCCLVTKTSSGGRHDHTFLRLQTSAPNHSLHHSLTQSPIHSITRPPTHPITHSHRHPRGSKQTRTDSLFPPITAALPLPLASIGFFFGFGRCPSGNRNAGRVFRLCVCAKSVEPVCVCVCVCVCVKKGARA
jgi:hypothetical protein